MDEEATPLLSGSDVSLDSYRATIRQLIEYQLVQGPGFYSNNQLLNYLNKNLDFVVKIIKTALEMQLFPLEPNRLNLDEETSNKPKCSQPSKSKPKRDNKIMFIQSDDSDEDEEASNYPRASKLHSTPKKPTFNFNINSKSPPGQKGKDSKKNKKKTETYEEVFDLTVKVNLRSKASKSGSIIKNLKNLEIKLTPKRRDNESNDDDDSDDSSSSSSISSSDSNPEKRQRIQFQYDAEDEKENDDDEDDNHYVAPPRKPKDQKSIVPQYQALITAKTLPLRNLQEYTIEANKQMEEIAEHRNNDSDIIPYSNPLTPLLGRHGMDLSEPYRDFDLSSSYLFEFVSSKREEKSYPYEKYDILSDTVKWAYLELNERNCDLLNHKRHERLKLSVALIRDYALFKKMNITNELVHETLTNHQSDLSLFDTIMIDPIFIDDVESRKCRSPSISVALMILDKYGGPMVHVIQNLNDHLCLDDILGSSVFDCLQQEEIFACWGEYYTNNVAENDLPNYTYYIGKDNQKDFSFGQIEYGFHSYENLKYNRIHTYKVIKFKAVNDLSKIPEVLADLKECGIAVEGELKYAIEEINRDIPLYHMMASGECEQLIDGNFWRLAYRDNEFAPNFIVYVFPDNQIGKVACAFNFENKLELDILIDSAVNEITQDLFWADQQQNLKNYKLYGYSKVQRIDLGTMLKNYRDNIRGVVVYDKEFEERGIESKCVCLNFDMKEDKPRVQINASA